MKGGLKLSLIDIKLLNMAKVSSLTRFVTVHHIVKHIIFSNRKSNCHP